MLDQRLAIDPHALLARAPDGLVRLLAGHMHDVERHARRIGDHDGAVGGLAFDLRRPRIGVPLGPGEALLHVFFLERRHHVAVLGMDERHGAERGTAAERREHLVVVDHQRALVGHEMLEGVDAAPDDLGHLVVDLLVPVHDRAVIADIDADLVLRLGVPGIDGAQQRAVLAGQDEINQHGGPAGRRRPGAGLEGLGGGRAHERHFQMRVRVDPAGDDIGLRGIDDLVAGQVLADGGDLLAFDQDIGLPGPVRGEDGAALDDFAHSRPPLHLVPCASRSGPPAAAGVGPTPEAPRSPPPHGRARRSPWRPIPAKSPPLRCGSVRPRRGTSPSPRARSC